MVQKLHGSSGGNEHHHNQGSCFADLQARSLKKNKKLLRNDSSPSDDCVVLGECRIDLLQELYQEMREKWNMPVVASLTHATWGITLLEFPLVSPCD